MYVIVSKTGILYNNPKSWQKFPLILAKIAWIPVFLDSGLLDSGLFTGFRDMVFLKSRNPNPIQAKTSEILQYQNCGQYKISKIYYSIEKMKWRKSRIFRLSFQSITKWANWLWSFSTHWWAHSAVSAYANSVGDSVISSIETKWIQQAFIWWLRCIAWQQWH